MLVCPALIVGQGAGVSVPVITRRLRGVLRGSDRALVVHRTVAQCANRGLIHSAGGDEQHQQRDRSTH